MNQAKKYLLLGDEPDVIGDDPLGFHLIAAQLTHLIRESRDNTPFTVGIEAPWGMGKSSLMMRMRASLDSMETRTIWFNAWRFEGEEVLEGLIKSVLFEIQNGPLKRAMKGLHTRFLGRFFIQVISRWLKLENLVDQIWDRLTHDPRLRNEFNNKIAEAMQHWIDETPSDGPLRQIVVFIDDLDRCKPEGVIQVFEAIKLYLGLPGMVFVIGYDPEMVAEAVKSERDYSDEVLGKDYVEKIIQVAYQIPRSSDEQIDGLASHLVDKSRTDRLFGENERRLITEGNNRNPRRMKRFINSFILDYELLNPEEGMTETLLVKGLILRMYFRGFADLFSRTKEKNVIEDFRDYTVAKAGLRSGAKDAAQIVAVFDSYGIPVPSDDETADKALARLESYLPPGYVTLSQDDAFHTLMDSLSDETDQQTLERWIVKSIIERDTAQPDEATEAPSRAEGEFFGLRVLWIDDNPKRNAGLVRNLEEGGADIQIAVDLDHARKLFEAGSIDVLVSDVKRGTDPLAGFTDLEAIRTEGMFAGPAAVYTLRPTEAVRDRGKELDVPILLNRRELLNWLSLHVVDDASDSEVGAELEGSRAVKGVGSRKKKKQPADRKKATKKKATKKKPAKKKATKRKVRR